MGAGVSAGENNDDLVDNLMEADYIKTSKVERVFRAVDRGEYFLPPPPPVNPYRDVAWKFGDFHISAPCIYSEVMEALKLEPGLSFLNLGSGTGYLSTMAGLLLGHNGINHGIELRESLIQYAYTKLEDFKKHSGAMDEFDFCEPKFIQGNCLCIPSGSYLYDRVYCGASCPEQYPNYMKHLIKVGGVLVMPLNDHLMEMTRTSETNWNCRSLLPVSFAGLVEPTDGSTEMVKFFEFEPRSLLDLSRTTIRNLLRKSIESDFPSIKSPTSSSTAGGSTSGNKASKSVKKKRPLRRLVHAARNNHNSARVDDDDSSDDDECFRMFKPLETNATKLRGLRRSEDLFDYFLKSVAKRYQGETTTTSTNSDTTSADDYELNTDRRIQLYQPQPNSPAQHRQSCSKTEQVKAIIERAPSDRDDYDYHHRVARTENKKNLLEERQMERMQNVFIGILSKYASPDEASTSAGTSEVTEKEETDETKDKIEPMSTEDPSTSSATTDNNTKSPDKRKNRTKFDSGLGDEIISISPPETVPADVPVVSSSCSCSSDSSEDDENDDDDIIKKAKRTLRCNKDKRSSSKWRKIEQDSSDSSDYESDSIREKSGRQMMMYKSPYSAHLENRIRDLPLPSILKKYLLYYREI